MIIIKRIELQILYIITAAIFNEKPKNVLLLSGDKGLILYAGQTRDWMNKHTDSDMAREMYIRMYRLGKAVRSILFVRSQKRALNLVKHFYKSIGITVDFKTEKKELIMEVSSCIFSKYYDKKMCGFMSSMDKGIICGLTAQKHLRFTKRLTEGCEYCVAKLYS